MADAIITDADLIAAFETRIAAAPDLGVHLLANMLDTPYDMPKGVAHGGCAVALRSTRNMGLSRNRTVARMRGVVAVTLAYMLGADQRAGRAAALAQAAAVKDRITDLGWTPGGVVDQIRYVGATYAYHPTGRGWYTSVLTFETDFDTVLGEV